MKNNTEPTPRASRSAVAPPALWKDDQSPLALGRVSCGGIGALLFTVTYLIEGVTQPGYDAFQQAISALSLGPNGWVQQVNFIVFGSLLTVSAVGWYRVMTPGRQVFWFPLFTGIGGLGLIGVGVVTSGALHTFLAYTLIIALALGCFALGSHLWGEVHRRGWAVYSWVTGALMLIFWGAFAQGATGHVAALTPIAGLTERVSAGSHALWVCVITTTLLVQYTVQRRSRRS